MKNFFCVICITAILVCNGNVITSQAADAELQWINVMSARTEMVFDGSTATCRLVITGNSNTKSISGVLKLVDNTTGINVSTWNIYSDRSCDEFRTAPITGGHHYTLSFSGNVYPVSGAGEYLTVSTSRQN